MIAAHGSAYDVVDVLISANADVNAAGYSDSDSGNTALILAILDRGWGPSEKVAALLLDHGADPNGTGDYGLTPMYHAARAGLFRTVMRLLSHGATPGAGELDIAADLIGVQYVSSFESPRPVPRKKVHEGLALGPPFKTRANRHIAPHRTVARP